MTDTVVHMDRSHVIIQSSTFDGAQNIIWEIMDQYSNVTATIPAKAADGSYMASVHYWGDKLMEIK